MCNFKPPLVSVAMAGFAGPELWNVEILCDTFHGSSAELVSR